MLYLDAHVDTITAIMRNNEQLYDNSGHLSLKMLENFEASVIFFAVFYHSKTTERLFTRFIETYAFLKEQVSLNSEKAAIALSFADIKRHVAEGKISAVPAIEDGAILEGSIENFHTAADMGVRYVTLTWNFPNEVGEPSETNGGGLTHFGKALLGEMKARGVLADVSHLSEAGFWDVYNFGTPFIASHSNCKALCGHHRNLTDSQLKAIGEAGGCIGLNVHPGFLAGRVSGSKSRNPRAGAGIDDVCRHADHMLKFAGTKSVGLGTDFDGITATPEGLANVSQIPSLYDTFLTRYGKELTQDIFFNNFMRVLEKNTI